MRSFMKIQKTKKIARSILNFYVIKMFYPHNEIALFNAAFNFLGTSYLPVDSR